MKEYLLEKEFNEEEIATIINNNPQEIIDLLDKKEKLIKANLDFLKDYGVVNYKDIFIKHAEIFLQEASIFKKTFTKYEKTDLIQKLQDNVDLIVLL